MPPKKKLRTSKKDDGDDGAANSNVSAQDVLKIKEIRDRIFSFVSSAKELCSLDLVNREFRRDFTPPAWNELAMKTYGLANGKGGWRKGTSLLREPVFFELHEEGDFGLGCSYPGSAQMTCNGSIIATVSDDIDSLASDRTYPLEGSNPFTFRDARTLNFIRAMPTPDANWRVALCGRQGAEVIVTSNHTNRLSAFQGDRRQVTTEIELPASGSGTPLLGCETHLLAFGQRKIFVFKAGDGDTLLTLCNTESIASAAGVIADDSARWAPDHPYHFSFACENNDRTNAICIWKLDSDTSQVEQVKEIQPGFDGNVCALAVGERYIAAACKMKMIHVYDWNTGEKIHGDLCDVSEDKRLEEDDLIYPLAMEPVGDLLVSTSHLGHSLCIWNMKTGQLLKRYDNATDSRSTDPLPEGTDVTSMIRLKHFPAFVTMAYSHFVWAFPEDSKSKKMIASIERREKAIGRAIRDEILGGHDSGGDY